MNSIQQTVRIIKGNLGLKIEGQKDKWRGVMPPSRSRGDIKGFSRASRKRLRLALAMARPKDSNAAPWGLCLTIPGESLDPSKVRALWHEFIANHIKRHFADVPFIWRIELQQLKRKQAHWHCIAWCDNIQVSLIRETWLNLVLKYATITSLSTLAGIDKHCVKIDSLVGASSSSIIGYLADHTSKHKQAQLGWKGRQWGIVNRSRLDFSPVDVTEISEEEHKQATRQMRRLQRNLRERGGKYTGAKISPDGKVSAAIFGNDEKRYLACVAMAKRNSGKAVE